MADQIDVGPPPVRLAGGRSYKGIVLATVVVVLGAAAVFAWLSYGDRLSEQVFSSATPAGPGGTSPASVGDSVSSVEFSAFQAQTAASLQSATQLLGAQQAELKRLSDQIAGLTARIDGLQSTIATPAPTASVPLAAPVPPATAPVAGRPATAPRKRAAPPPAGAISVGGAPLPGTAPARR